MFDVLGQMRLSLRLGTGQNQREIPINPSLLDEFLLIQNNLLKVPIIQMTFHDNLGLQESSANFVDGSPFSIDVGWDQEDEPYRSHPFRLFTIPGQVSTTEGVKISLLGYLDIPRYFRRRYDKAFSGSSYQLIEDIAMSNDLPINLRDNPIETNDAMNWLPDGRNQADYARYVTNHGWIDDESCMELAITQIPDTESQEDTQGIPWMVRYLNPVSYTHLTLPTNREV